MHPASFRLLPARRPVLRAFTLIELLTVIAIIGILAAILIPTVGSVRAKAKTVKCSAQLRSWSDAIRLFSTENKGNIPLLINLSADTDLHFYSAYFNTKSMDSLGLKDKSTVNPMEYFSVCPAVDRTGLVSGDESRRYYNFVIPGGVKTALKDTMFCGRKLSKDVNYYNFESLKSPSRLFMMLEQMPGGDGSTVKASNYVTSSTDFVKKIMINPTDKSLIRHNGRINVLFADGSVRSQSWADIEFRPGGSFSLTTDPRFNL
jgi:prepilin-type N-terminal cleavage/methylation domain-containing protein/prepilin-type processing-associated H-X9-DG protein